MNQIWAIAANTFRENRRDRVLYVLVLFATLMIVAGVAVSELSPFEQTKVLLDLGQAAMSMVGSLIAILLGVSLIAKEIDKRTIYVIISKPVSRNSFLLGKALGLALTLSAALVVMASTLAAVTWAYGTAPTLAMAESVFLLWIELLVLVAMSVLFATFTSSSTLSAILSFGCWIIGMVVGDLGHIASTSKSTVASTLLSVAWWTFPDLSLFDIKARATYGIPLPPADLALTAGYGLAYTAALFCLASVIFTRRDFR